MDIPSLCVALGFFTVFLPKWTVFKAAQRLPEGYNHREPRAQQATIPIGPGARALAAHLNGFEAFAPFAASVILAKLAGATSAQGLDAACIVFVGARVLYTGAYVAGFGNVRTFWWAVGFLAILFNFALASFPVLWTGLS
jgi:uncharacterized MAPEG superfamily protein